MIVEMLDHKTLGKISNSEIDKETCEFYAKRSKGRDKWKNSPVSCRQCKKCHGKGYLHINQPHMERDILITCSCVNKTIEKHKVNMDKLYDK